MVMRRRVLRAIGQLELGGRGQGGLARLANLEHCAVQRRDGGEALGLCIRVSRERTTVFIAQRQTDLVLRALCVKHGEQHLAVAITALFVGRKDLAQAGRGRLRGVALSVCWAPLSQRKAGSTWSRTCHVEARRARIWGSTGSWLFMEVRDAESTE